MVVHIACICIEIPALVHIIAPAVPKTLILVALQHSEDTSMRIKTSTTVVRGQSEIHS